MGQKYERDGSKHRDQVALCHAIQNVRNKEPDQKYRPVNKGIIQKAEQDSSEKEKQGLYMA